MRPVLVIGKRNARGSATKHVCLNVQAVTFGVQKKLPVVCARMPLPAPGLYTVNGWDGGARLLGLIQFTALTLVVLIALLDLGSAALEFLQIRLLVALRALHFLSRKIGHFGSARSGT